MHFDVQAIIGQYGYVGVFIALLIEMVGIPFPAETVLTLVGIEWTRGVFSLQYLLIAAVSGHFLGATIAFWLGRALGRPVLVRYGRRLGVTEDKLTKADAKFGRYRSLFVFISKFIAGVRVLVPYLAGINRMPIGLFLIWNAAGAVLWSAAFIVLGRYLGVAWDRYHLILHQLLLPTALIATIVVATALLRRRRRSAS